MANRRAATFVLLPGASSDAWHWHLVGPRLSAAGHEVVAVDLPLEDDSCGLAEYAAAVVEAIGDRRGLIVVAQSMAAYTAPLVAAQVPVEQLVLVAPMVPAPGETPGEWWANTGQREAARRLALEEGRDPDRPFDPIETFLHDVAPEVVAESAHHVLRQSDRPFGDRWPLERWPEVTTRAVIGTRDRLFPRPFLRSLLLKRIGITPDEIDSGHLPALARPGELAAFLLRSAAEPVGPEEAALGR